MIFLRILRMGACKLKDNQNECEYDPNLSWDDLDDSSKERCVQEGGPNGCKVREQQGGARRRRGRKSRKGRKGLRRRTQRRRQ